MIDASSIVRVRTFKPPTCTHELCKLMHARLVGGGEMVQGKQDVETGSGVRLIADKEFSQRCKKQGLDAWKPSHFELSDSLITKRPHYVTKRLPLSDSE